MAKQHLPCKSYSIIKVTCMLNLIHEMLTYFLYGKNKIDTLQQGFSALLHVLIDMRPCW